MLLGGRILLISAKLARKIAEDHYVNIAELHPDFLEDLNPAEEDQPKLTEFFSIKDLPLPATLSVPLHSTFITSLVFV